MVAGSNHRAIFHNIPPGTHNLRIVAGNNKKDKIVVKIKIHVSGTDTSFCAANLINDRVAHMSNSVMVYFKGTNSGNRFRCSLNKQASFECTYVFNHSISIAQASTWHMPLHHCRLLSIIFEKSWKWKTSSENHTTVRPTYYSYCSIHHNPTCFIKSMTKTDLHTVVHYWFLCCKNDNLNTWKMAHGNI